MDEIVHIFLLKKNRNSFYTNSQIYLEEVLSGEACKYPFYEYHEGESEYLEGIVFDSKQEGIWRKKDYIYGRVEEFFCWKNIKQELSTTYYGNGNKRSEGEYSFGERIGLWFYYYSDGTLESKIHYVDEYKDGPFEEYYKNGNLKTRGSYKWEKKIGIWFFHNEDGSLKSTKLYEGGKEIGRVTLSE